MPATLPPSARWPLLAALLAALPACDPTPAKSDSEAPTGDSGTAPLDGDADGFTAEEGDCNDASALISPAAEEVCDGVDNDCDDAIDEAGTTSYYADGDGDGFGDPTTAQVACAAPDGFVANDRDCDDGAPTTYPGAFEICDGKDNDCDGATDEDGASTYYADLDGDSFGDPDQPITDCDARPGTSAQAGDCDDGDPTVHPDAAEVCDGLDNNCDGDADEDALDAAAYFYDGDGDGAGNCDASITACEAPPGYTASGCDCNDGNPAVTASSPEICDGLDNDCDGLTDDTDPSVDLSAQPTWYTDADNDSYGDPSTATTGCDQPAGTTLDSADCDDNDPYINPGQTEACNGYDDDCDGLTDDGDPGVDLSAQPTWYTDADSDSYGDPSTAATGCDQPANTTLDATDCDDGDGAIYPGAAEVCNAYDDDCDGLIDSADPGIDPGLLQSWYVDSDLDGYGDPATAVQACDAPADTTADGSDCDDADPDIHPGAYEVHDDTDQDCDGYALLIGDGRDGDLLSGGGVLPWSTSATSGAAGDLSLSVADTSGLSAGDVVLIWTSAGAGAGTWGLYTATSVAPGALDLWPPLQDDLDPADTHRVLRVPQYRRAEIPAGQTLSAATWSSGGTGGGIVALLVQEDLVISGAISASGAGYPGGARQGSRTVRGWQGQSYLGSSTTSSSANYGGGGGGYAPSLTHGDGGGGGHATPGTNGGYNGGYSSAPGLGGAAYGSADLLLPGSGGGSGGLDSDAEAGSYGGAGGAGGGIVLISAAILDGGGTISASGANGEDGYYAGGAASPGGGGGGAGGTAHLYADTLLWSGAPALSGGTGGTGSEAGAGRTTGGTGGIGAGGVMVTPWTWATLIR